MYEGKMYDARRKVVFFPQPSGRELSWYLSEEQHIASEQPSTPVFFLWRVSPTVIFGRHQYEEQEVNTAYCNEQHIAIVQRKSGGGCVYADEGNVMVSLIVPSTHAEQVFGAFIHTIANILQECSLPAVTTEHNDILVNGRKVSGNACYICHNCTIVHGTLLYDVNLSHLEQALLPPQDKLQRHSVKSVRQRVMNIRETYSSQFPTIQSLEQTIIDMFPSFFDNSLA